MIALLQLAAALYLAAAVASAAGVGLGAGAAVRAGLVLLGAGWLAHAASFVALHGVEPTPQLTDLPMAVSLMAWMVVLAYLPFARRSRMAGLAMGVGPVAFLGAFYAALRIPHAPSDELMGAGSWPHAHVVLASGGLALLAVAAIAGAAFLLENRRLKRKRLHPARGGPGLPSLETLDRVNAAALAVGFPLLTLGVVTGMLWVYGTGRGLWTGSAHEIWNALAWGIYAVLVGLRFAASQGARQSALSAVAGFAFLLFAAVGVGMLA